MVLDAYLGDALVWDILHPYDSLILFSSASYPQTSAGFDKPPALSAPNFTSF